MLRMSAINLSNQSEITRPASMSGVSQGRKTSQLGSGAVGKSRPTSGSDGNRSGATATE